MTSEIERLNTVLKTRVSEIEEWRSKYSQLETHLQIIKEYESRINQYEEKLALLSQEIQRLNGSLRSRSDEITELKSKIS